MNVIMELRKCWSKLFPIHRYEEQILADVATSGPHNPEQEKSVIWSKVMLLMETPLRILTGIKSLQNKLVIPQEIFFWKRFYKSCRAVGTRSSFSVRWFVSLNFLRICCASNIPNMKGSMDQITPHIRPVLLIGFAACHIKGLSWSQEQE